MGVAGQDKKEAVLSEGEKLTETERERERESIRQYQDQFCGVEDD